MSTKTVDLRPGRLNIKLYGADAWALELRLAALGDLTGATITASYKPNDGGDPLPLSVSMTDPVNSTFSVGAASTPPSSYDIQIALSGGLPRTYVYGSISVQSDVA